MAILMNWVVYGFVGENTQQWREYFFLMKIFFGRM
jgi:hypothetical protein